MTDKKNSAVVVQENSTPTQANPNYLLEMAIKGNVDIDKLEKLMELKERYEKNEARKLFFQALSQFQKDVPVLEKNKQISFGNTKYKFAPLGEIEAQIKDVLFECGLTKRWELNEKDGGNIVCSCIISHVAGHSETTTMSGQPDQSGGKNSIQQRASTVTYLQRYTLVAALGLTTADEDDDASSSGDRTEEKPRPSTWLNENTPEWNEHVVAPINNGVSPKQVLEDVSAKFKINKRQQDEIRAMKPKGPAAKDPTKSEPSKEGAKKIKLTAEHKDQWEELVNSNSTFKKGEVPELLRIYNNNVIAVMKKGVSVDLVAQTYDLDEVVLAHYNALKK